MKLFLVFLFVASCQARTFSKVSNYEEVDELVKVTEKMPNALKKEDLKEDIKLLVALNYRIAVFFKNAFDTVLAPIDQGSIMAFNMTHNTEMTHNLEKAAADRVNGLVTVPVSLKKFIYVMTRYFEAMEKQGGLEVVLGDIFKNIPEEVASKVEDDALEERGIRRGIGAGIWTPVIEIKRPAKDGIFSTKPVKVSNNRVALKVEDGDLERRDIWGDLDFIGRLRKVSDLKDIFHKQDKTRAEKLRPHFNEFKKLARDVEDDAFERRDWGKNRPEELQPHLININKLAQDVEDDAVERRDIWGMNKAGIWKPVIKIKRPAHDLLNNVFTISKNVPKQELEILKAFQKQLGDLV